MFQTSSQLILSDTRHGKKTVCAAVNPRKTGKWREGFPLLIESPKKLTEEQRLEAEMFYNLHLLLVVVGKMNEHPQLGGFMVVYHGRIRKISPSTNPSSFQRSKSPWLGDKSSHCQIIPLMSQFTIPIFYTIDIDLILINYHFTYFLIGLG